MTRATPVNRRTALTAAAGAAAMLGLAACSSGTAESGAPTPTAPGGGVSPTNGGQQGLVALASIPVGEAVAANIGRKPIVVARPTADTVAAFTAICTHMGCTVNVDGAVLKCPCHGSQYNALTGAVTRGPAAENLAAVPVTLVNGEVVAS